MSTSPRRRPPAARRAYHHGDLRRALVEAGLSLLEAQGEFSLRELSRNVDVSANAAYRHFRDKAALLQTLAAEGFRRLMEAQAKAAMAEADPMERHRAAGKTYVRFAMAHPALFRLMFSRNPTRQGSDELTVASETAFSALRAGAALSLNLDIDDERVSFAAIRSWSLVHGLTQLILAGLLEEFQPKLDDLLDAVLRPVAPVPPRGRRRTR